MLPDQVLTFGQRHQTGYSEKGLGDQVYKNPPLFSGPAGRVRSAHPAGGV